MFESCRRNQIEEVIKKSLPFLFSPYNVFYLFSSIVLFLLSLLLIMNFFSFPINFPFILQYIHLKSNIFYFLTLNICVYRIKLLLLHIDKFMCN